MAALTWQNVNGPSLAEASKPLEAAGAGFTAAFTGLDDLLKKRQATETANWDQGKVNNTNAFLAGVQNPQTPEEFAAQKIALQQQLTGYGAQVDAVAGRNALDGRLATLQNRSKAAWEYDNAAIDQKDAPLRDEASMLFAQGKYDEGKAVADKVQRNKAILFEAAKTGQRKGVLEGYEDVSQTQKVSEEARKAAAAPVDLRVKEANIRQSDASAAASYASSSAEKLRGDLLKIQSDDAKVARASALRLASSQAILKGTIYEGGTYSGKNAQEISTLIDGTTGNRLDDADKNAMKTYIATLEAAGGIQTSRGLMPIPLDFLKSQILGAKDEGWGWSTGGVNYLERSLKAAMEATVPGGTDDNNQPLPDRSPALDGYHALLNAQRAAINDPVVDGKGGSSPKSPGAYKPPKPSKDHKPK
jgi:hypothetical protein